MCIRYVLRSQPADGTGTPNGGSGAREPRVRISFEDRSQPAGSDPPGMQSGEHSVAVAGHRQQIPCGNCKASSPRTADG